MFNILVIDDDKNIRFLMREVFEREHYNVFTAEDGVMALEILENTHIDIVIVDIMMPKIDGYEFTRQIRLTNKETPILMVSAKQLPEDRKKGYLSGIDDYMSKPLDTEELILHVKALLRRAKEVSERKIKIGQVVLDCDALTATVGGVREELPQKEFMLLYKLLSFPDKIFTRIQLMDEIWGLDSETGWETVTVHIGRLRKRFENCKDFEIVCIRGLGYKAVIKNDEN